MLTKAKYYNDSLTACSIMLDDLVPAAVYPFQDNNVWAKYDWGYLMDSEHSIYKYLERNLLQKYPEIRGTIFLPLYSHRSISENEGYRVFKREIDEEYTAFLKRLSLRFDFAFHGTIHGKRFQTASGFKNIMEFEDLTLNDVASLRSEIDQFTGRTGIVFTGGKYPGYKKNEHSENIIRELGFRWWASSAAMINKTSELNRHTYFGEQDAVLNLPTNLSGDLFSGKSNMHPLKKKLAAVRNLLSGPVEEQILRRMLSERLPVTIQEHFQNQGTTGRRQTPNLFDDMISLDRIYGMLRPYDIWCCTCSELAHYLESFDHTIIKAIQDGTSEIVYTGNHPSMFLSFVSDSEILRDQKNETIFKGVRKNGKWIYNSLKPGIYTVA